MIGTTLAHYRITAALGAGGMGEVWKAEDTKLGREVALKVLPEAFASDPDRLARFEREAKVLASLNHPNIAHLYGLESVNTRMAAGTAAPQGSRADEKGLVGHASRVPDTVVESPSGADVGPNSKLKTQNSKLPASAGTVTFLVMELVEGEDLSARISRGSIPVPEAIPIALQIAEALEAAHEQGIVHRDLKPANIKITDDGTVKVLDFGLAKLSGSASAAGDPSEAPTMTQTQAGVILGTAAYMSPEQASGKIADQRADNWAFGVVLWEMMTGRRLFDGASSAEVRAAVLTEDLDYGILSGSVPPAVRDVLRRCLEREPRRRLQHVGDARLVLEDVRDGREATAVPITVAARQPVWIPWVIAGVLGVVALGFGLRAFDQPEAALDSAQPVQFEINLPDDGMILPAEIMTRLALSPDGRRLVFVARVDGGDRLYVRDLTTLDALPITGGVDASSPFWSSDSRSVGFFSNGRLMRVDVGGGPPSQICEAALQGRAVWGDDGTIVFAELDPAHSGLARVDARGGDPAPLTTLDRDANEVIHLWPQFLPDQNGLLYLRLRYAEDRGEMVRELMVTSLDGNEPRVVMPLDSRFEIAPTGHILFARERTLLAQPFDVVRAVPMGEPIPLVSEISYLNQTGYAEFTASRTGAVAVHGSLSTTELVLVDRDGRAINRVGKPGPHGVMRLDPSGRMLAVESYDDRLGSRDIWVHDLQLGTARRLTLGSSDDTDPIWWPDRQQVVFASDVEGAPDIYRVSLSGGGGRTAIIRAPFPLEPMDILPASGEVIYSVWSRATNIDLWRADPDDPHSPQPFVNTVHSETQARVSRDGRWVVFLSDETGSEEIYVASTDDASSRRRVSVEGGWSPLWRADSRELYFLSPQGAMVVGFDPENGKLAGRPEPLFEINHQVWRGAWDAMPDGERFIINLTVHDSRRDPIRVILNWPALVESTESGEAH